MQDILDRGLGSEDRKTLRKLASVGGLAEGVYSRSLRWQTSKVRLLWRGSK